MNVNKIIKKLHMKLTVPLS